MDQETRLSQRMKKSFKAYLDSETKTSVPYPEVMDATSTSDKILDNLLRFIEDTDEQNRMQPINQQTSPQRLGKNRSTSRRELKRRNPSPQKLHTSSHSTKQKSSYNRKFFAISAAKSSSELMTVQRAVEEALRGTRKSKHTLSPNHDKNKRSTTKSKQLKISSLFTERSRSRDQVHNLISRDQKSQQASEIAAINLVIPSENNNGTESTQKLTNLASAQSSFKPLSVHQEVAREVSNVLKQKLDVIQNQIAQLQHIPAQLSKQKWYVQNQVQQPQVIQKSQTQNALFDLLREKEDEIENLKSQVEANKSLYQNQKQRSPSRDAITIVKPSSLHNDLVNHLTSQLKESTHVIKSQQTQINHLKLKLQKAQQALADVKPQVQVIQPSAEHLKLISELKQLLKQSSEDQDQMKSQLIIKDQDLNRINLRLERKKIHLNATKDENHDLNLKLRELTNKLQSRIDNKNETQDIEKLKIELEQVQQKAHEQLETQRNQYECQLDQMAEQNIQIERNLKAQLKQAKDQLAIEQQKWQLQVKEEFDSGVAEQAAAYEIQISSLRAQILSKTEEHQQMQNKLESKLVNKDKELQQNKEQLQEKIKQQALLIEQLKKEVKTIEDQQQTKEQNEVIKLKEQLENMKEESRLSKQSWNELQEQYTDRIKNLEAVHSQLSSNNNEAETALKIRQFEEQADQDAQSHQAQLNVLETKLKKALQDVKDAKQEKKDQGVKMAKAAKEQMDQTNKDKKQIKELEKKIVELESQSTSTQKSLTSEREDHLLLQIKQNQVALDELRDEYRIQEGQIKFINKQRDDLESEIEKLKQSKSVDINDDEVQEIKSKLSDSQQECNQLKQKLNSIERESDRYTLSLKETQTELNNLKSQVIDQKAQSEQLSSEILRQKSGYENQLQIVKSESASQIQSLTQQNKDLNSQLTKAISLQNQLEKQVEVLEGQLAAAQNESESLKKQLEQHLVDLKILQSEKSIEVKDEQVSSEKSISMLQNQLQSLEEKLKKQSSWTDHEQTISDLKEEIKAMDELNQQMEVHLSEVQESEEQLRNQLEQEQFRANEVEQQYQEQIQQLEQQIADIDADYAQQIEQLRDESTVHQELVEYQEKYEEMKLQENELLAQISALEERIQQSEQAHKQELDSVTDSCQELISEQEQLVEEARAQIALLEKQIKELKTTK